ncbi:hypothetical protein TRSC58_06696 [Trypanosoma rangeli SC58]|uniref:C3H1-type domain-containing protein n=1 Tax=Trypanosoma rangeli SC58 TaxID=429131 RepID=A0A061IUW4_TRYRA|nr:hypothetical protein TRSC58_06696 [Trypanosoma rangeli SC58]
MGRGKGRAKGIDVTKHFFQASGPSDRILVQISPSQTVYVTEEDLSPTQGSEAAFALKREGRMENPIKLCASWRQGTCLSRAACSSAHVVAYFNHPATSMGGGHNGATTPGSALRRQHDDGNHTAAQQHQTHHQHNFHAGTTVGECTRVVEHKSPAATTHSTLIPAPRSQQANRQASSLAAASATVNSPGAAMAWGRNVAVNGNQHGGYPSQRQQQQQQHPRHTYPQQQQQHDVIKQQHSTPQSRGSRGSGGGHRAQEDINWVLSNRAIGGMLLDAASTQHSGKTDGGRVGISTMAGFSSSSNNNNLSKADGTSFTPSDSLSGTVGDESWVALMLGQSSVNSTIWNDGFAGIWDVAPSAGATTTSRAEATTLEAGEPPLLMTHDLNTMAAGSTHGELWGSLSGSNAESAASTSKPAGTSFRSEALKSQLLRELVGAESDSTEPTAAETLVKNSTNQKITAPSTPLTETKNSSGLLHLLGGDDGDAGFFGHAGSSGCLASAPSRNVHTIQHLMSLLTTE